ncbi:MAG: AraC family transcriptional regulator [Verrucomicrobiota bacterium]
MPRAGKFVERKGLPYHLFEWVVSGKGMLMIDGGSQALGSGSLYFLREGQRHRFQAEQENPWRKRFWGLQGELVDLLIERYLKQQWFLKIEPVALHLFSEIWNYEKLNHKPGSKPDLGLLFHRFIVSLSSKKVEAPEFKARDLLDQQTEAKVDMVEIARLSGTSISQLNRRFKKRFGTSPYTYHLARKKERAKVLLQDSEMMIANIADQLGFYDEFHFSKWFKKVEGVSPSKIRKN